MNKYDDMKQRLRERAGLPAEEVKPQAEKVYSINLTLKITEPQMKRLMEMMLSGEINTRDIEAILLL